MMRIGDHQTLCKLKHHMPVSAAWSHACSNMTIEILAEAGFDAVVIDMEHAPADMSTLITLMQALKGTKCAPFVRVPWNDSVWIKRVLDAGAYGIHIPYISTKKEAEEAVKGCKYPPKGFRGVAGSQRAVCYGLKKEQYYQTADQDIVLMVAIETPEGVSNIDAIAAVEDINGIFIGPSDLSASMGHIGNPMHPEVQEAIRMIEKTAYKHGKFLGTIASDMEAAGKLYDRGYSIVYFMSDTVDLAREAERRVELFKQYMQGKEVSC